MTKYNDFINEVRKIRGLKSIGVEYNTTYDSIYIHFDSKQWSRIDNEDSKIWESFRDLLDKYDYHHGFYCQYIEVYDEE